MKEDIFLQREKGGDDVTGKEKEKGHPLLPTSSVMGERDPSWGYWGGGRKKARQGALDYICGGRGGKGGKGTNQDHREGRRGNIERGHQLIGEKMNAALI